MFVMKILQGKTVVNLYAIVITEENVLQIKLAYAMKVSISGFIIKNFIKFYLEIN